MTWRPASAQKMPGHVLIHRSPDLYWSLGENSYDSLYRTEIKKFRPTASLNLRISVLPHLVPVPYRFFNVREKLLYVNGRSEVYEVALSCGWLCDVVFDPVMKYCEVPVLFQKLHKLEWLFG